MASRKKRCNGCRSFKALTGANFGRAGKYWKSRCKPCEATASRKYGRAHRPKISETKRHWTERNRAKVNKSVRDWRKRNPRKCRDTYRRYQLKKRFGLTPADYDLMFQEQEGRCDICQTHQNDLRRRLAVDHEHQTQKIRALLCGACNMMIGQAKESIDILERAISYLERHSLC